jgi:hypothetical protein
MTRAESLTIVAIIAGPILALGAQRVLDRIREKKKRRVDVFLTLMSTRASQLAPAHIQALNSIDVIFKRRWRDRSIRDAWHKVLEQVSSDVTKEGWSERVNDLKVDLYQAMGRRVGYNFSIDYLKRQVYLPKHYTDLEQDQLILRQRMVKVVTDDGIKVVVIQEPLKKD